MAEAARLAAALALVSIAVLRTAVASEDRPQAATMCASEDGASWCSSAESRAASFVQVSQDRARVSTELHRRAHKAASDSGAAASTQVSESIRGFLAVPANVGAALAAGVMAVRTSLPFFTGERPQLAKGFTHLGTKLFDAVSMIIPEETKQSKEFEDLEQAWDEMVQALPATMESLATGITTFNAEGDISAFVGVCTSVIKELATLITSAVPGEVSTEVAKYMGALEDALDGFDEAMEAFAAGNTTAAAAAVYSGIRSAASGLLPEGLRDDETFKAVAGALDIVFEDLSRSVLTFQQHLLQSAVCWKDWVGRDRKRPDQCPSHTHYDGKHWCIHGSTGSPSLLDTSVTWKRPRGAVAPSCVDDSDFSLLRGSWCYKDCSYGSEPSGTRCKSVCMGDYPVDSPLMCGKSPGTVRTALMEMTIRIIRAFFSIKEITEQSGSAGSLQGTIASLVDLGAGFAHPKCPVLTGQ